MLIPHRYHMNEMQSKASLLFLLYSPRNSFSKNQPPHLNRIIHRTIFFFLEKIKAKQAFLTCDVLKCPGLVRIPLRAIKTFIFNTQIWKLCYTFSEYQSFVFYLFLRYFMFDSCLYLLNFQVFSSIVLVNFMLSILFS